MALEEISFTNTDGEEISLSNLVNQMINFYNLKLEVGETRITDFNEGSEIRNLLEAFAVCIYALLDEQHEATKIAFISTSHDGFLDQIGEMPFINLPRKTGKESTGIVTFTLSKTLATEAIIPAGTIVAASSSGMEFVTDDDCIIEIGQLSADMSVTCMVEGVEGNIASGAVDTIVDPDINTELVTVSNSSAFEEGADYEDDESYRERLLENVRAAGFGTMDYYINLCSNIDGVHDVLLIDTPNYTKKVIVNGTTKPTPANILLEVLTELTNTSNIVLNHSFTIDRPTYTDVSLTISLDVSTIIPGTELEQNLIAYVNGLPYDRMEWTGLNINQALTKEMVIEACTMFGDVVNVNSVAINGSEDTTIIEPSENGVIRLSAIEIQQSEV